MNVLSLPTLDDLCAHVHKTLCDKNALDPNQSPLRRMVIKRRGRPCGLFFEVAGTRLMRNYAVWAGEENRMGSAQFRQPCGRDLGLSQSQLAQLSHAGQVIHARIGDACSMHVQVAKRF
jgi:hypothetical protein